MSRGTRLYEEYLLKKKREKEEAKRLQDSVDQEIDMIKKYLDEEEKFIKVDQDREKKITEDELKKIQDEYKKLNEDIIDPFKKKVDDMASKVKEEQVLEDKGVQDIDLDDVLDEDDGIKQGLKVPIVYKITYNNIFEFPKLRPFRVRLDVFFDDKLIFDEYGNPGIYDTPFVDDHVPITKTYKRKKKAIKVDVAIDEVHYVLKHFPAYLQLFKNKGQPKDLYLRFVVEDVALIYPDGRTTEISERICSILLPIRKSHTP